MKTASWPSDQKTSHTSCVLMLDGAFRKSSSIPATVLVIGAENGCLKFATAEEREGGIRGFTKVAGTKLVRGIWSRPSSLYFQARRG